MRKCVAVLAMWMAASLLVSVATAQDRLADRVAADLKAYYEESERQPFLVFPDDPPRAKKPAPWETPLKELSAAAPATREQAAAYLRALLDQALSDERSGKARWRATPFFHGESVNAAVTLRERIADALAESPATPAALPIVRWYLEHEPRPVVQQSTMKALARLNTQEADGLRVELARQPHANAAVVLAALDQIIARKQTLDPDKLALLCQHHRASIRAKARELNEQQKGMDPGPFDAARAMQAPGVRKLLADVDRLMIDPPPAKAKFVAVTTTYFDKIGKEKEYVVRGWLLKEEANKIDILTPFGRRQQFELHATPVKSPGKNESMTCTMAAVTARQAVDRLLELRKKGDGQFALSERGELTGQFERGRVTLYEIMLVHWLHTRQEDGLAAEVLLPALDHLYRDEHFVLIARAKIGDLLGQQMLVAFVGERDYAKAERLAWTLAERFPATRYHEVAVRLNKQLPARGEDFKKLTLPTAKEWAALKPTLTRAQQIDYLCRRMRLLNSFQWGQPGDVVYSDTQFAEASGMSEDAAWSGNKGKTEVVNPLMELAGPVDGPRVPGAKQAKGLDLTVADIAYLAPFLKDDWYLLMVSFHRDFAPDRRLHATRELFTGRINHLAMQDICRKERFEKMTPQEQDRDIQRLVAWSRANAGKNEPELLIAGLEDGLNHGDDWIDVMDRAGRLVELKEKKAPPILVRFLDSKATDDHGREEILALCRRLDGVAARDASLKYLQSEHVGLRVEAALIQFESGKRTEGREVLANALAQGPLPGRHDVPSRLANDRRGSVPSKSWLFEVVDALLNEGSEPSRQAAAQLFANKQLALLDEPRDRARVLRRFAAAKLPHSFQFYLPLLDVTGRDLGQVKLNRPVAETFAEEITTLFAPDDPAIRAIAKNSPKTADRLPALKQWLEDRSKNPRSVGAAEK